MAKSSISNWRASGGALEITAVHSGSEAVTATAESGKIVVDFSRLGSGETVTVNTPFKFTVYDAVLVVGNGENVASKTLTVKNNSTALTSALSMATDKARVATATLDEDQAVFDTSDNDLVLTSSAHADGGGTLYLYYR